MDAEERIRTAIMYGLAYAMAHRPAAMNDTEFQEAAIDAIAREIDRVGGYDDDGTFTVEPDDQTED